MATLQLAIDARGAATGAVQFNGATASISDSAAKAANAVDKVSGSNNTLMSSFKRLVGVVSAGAVFKYMISNAWEAEKAQSELAAALSDTGKQLDSVMSKFNGFASEMQKLTIYDDDLIISQMAYAKNLGVTTSQLDDAAIAAAGLAAKYRMDLASAMQLIGRASQGQTQMLSRYGIVLDDSLTAQEKFTEVLRIGTDSFHLATAAISTSSGSWEQFKNSLGNVAQTFGEMIPSANGAAAALDSFNLRLTETISQNKAFTDSTESLESIFRALTIPLALCVDLGETFYGLMQLTATFLIGIPATLLEATSEAINGIEKIQNKLADSWIGKKLHIDKVDWDTSDIDDTAAANRKVQSELRDKAFYNSFQRDNLTGKVFSDMLNPPEKTTTEKSLKEQAVATTATTAGFEDAADAVQKFSTEQINAKEKIEDAFKTLEFERSLIGKSNDERERAVEMMKLQKEADIAYGAGTEENIRVMEEYRQKLIEVQKAQRGVGAFNQKIDDWVSSSTNVWANMGDVAVDNLNRMSDAISEMVMTGKIDFKSLCNEMIADIIKVQMRAAMASIVSSMTGSIGGIFGGVFGGSPAGDSNAAMSSYAAQGRVFSDGAVTPYAYGGIVESPTYFPMARGYGLMGEAGAEAVMPLTRINGKLGVQAVTSGESSNNIPPNVIINNNTGQPMKQQGKPQFNGKEWIISVVADNIDNYGTLYHKMRGNG